MNVMIMLHFGERMIVLQDTYRIFMLPISFIVATAYPVVDMRVFLDDPCPTTDNIKDLSSVKKVIRLQAVSASAWQEGEKKQDMEGTQAVDK